MTRSAAAAVTALTPHFPPLAKGFVAKEAHHHQMLRPGRESEDAHDPAQKRFWTPSTDRDKSRARPTTNATAGKQRAAGGNATLQLSGEDNGSVSAPATEDASLPCQPQQPVKRFIFIKTHKTGSSTITNLLFRQALRYDLRTVLPLAGRNRLNWPNQFDCSHIQGDCKPNYDAINLHFIWRPETAQMIRRLIPGNVPVFTIVRDPVSHFLSSYNYHPKPAYLHNKTGHVTPWLLQDMVTNWRQYFRPSSDYAAMMDNSMAFDLGILHRRENSQTISRKVIEVRIAHLVAKLDFFLVQNYWAESMALLARKFCWDLRTVVWFQLKKQTYVAEHNRVQELAKRGKLKERLWIDQLVFDSINASFWRDYKSYLPGIEDDVAKLRELTETQECRLKNDIEDYDECCLAKLDVPEFIDVMRSNTVGAPPSQCHR